MHSPHPATIPASEGRTIRGLLATATALLRSSSPTPRLDAELLLAHVLDWPRAHLLAEYDQVVDPGQVVAFEHLVQRRVRQEPVAYLVGQRGFYGLDLLVDRRVLVPRPETELLVDYALEAAQALRVGTTEAHARTALKIVDVGTGSGAIALALALRLPDACVYATDISAEGLEVARSNIARYNAGERVKLLQGDLLDPVPEMVDLIVSNPPYTILEEIDADVREYQPHLALDGGPDGLAVYRRLLQAAPTWLKPGGSMLLEIGATQATTVSTLARTMFPHAEVKVYPDLAGHDRILAVRTQVRT